MRIWYYVKKYWDMISSRNDGGLVKSGNWRVYYPDGKRTRGLAYGECLNLKEIFGGEIVYIPDETPAAQHRVVMISFVSRSREGYGSYYDLAYANLAAELLLQADKMSSTTEWEWYTIEFHAQPDLELKYKLIMYKGRKGVDFGMFERSEQAKAVAELLIENGEDGWNSYEVVAE